MITNYLGQLICIVSSEQSSNQEVKAKQHFDVALYFLELGSGWGPAILETKTEQDFIKQGQKGWSGTGDYFIGGSAASPVKTGTFKYHVSANAIPSGPVYSLSQSGNVPFL